jgi:hypothetical protein
MAVTPVALFVFGGRAAPRAPRAGIDVFPDALGMIGPENPVRAFGASSFADLSAAPLSGHYHVLPAGTSLPDGMGVVADGRDVDPMSPHPESHHTFYPSQSMLLEHFNVLFLGLPWQYGGKK